MNELIITNKDWIDFSTDNNGMCILTYNLGKLIKPVNEDADIGYIVMIVKAAMEISMKNTGNVKYHAIIRLKGASLFTLPSKVIIKTIKVLEKELPETICYFDIYDVEDKYIFIWDAIKSFIDKDTIKKITIHTTKGKVISSVENLEKNLNN